MTLATGAGAQRDRTAADTRGEPVSGQAAFITALHSSIWFCTMRSLNNGLARLFIREVAAKSTVSTVRCEMRDKPSRLLMRRAISDKRRWLSSAAIEPELKVDSAGLKPSPIIDATMKAAPLKESSPRRKISNVKISEVLKAKHTSHWVEPVLSHDATVREAIVVCIERKLSAMMVVDRSSTVKKREQKCVGMITSRDLLRMLAADIKEGKSPEDILNDRIRKQMLPINQVIYGRPDETIGMC